MNWKEFWEIAKKEGNPSPQEKWALYILLGALALFYLFVYL